MLAMSITNFPTLKINIVRVNIISGNPGQGVLCVSNGNMYGEFTRKQTWEFNRRCLLWWGILRHVRKSCQVRRPPNQMRWPDMI